MSRISKYDKKILLTIIDNIENFMKIYELHYLTDEFYKNYLSGSLDDYEAKSIGIQLCNILMTIFFEVLIAKE